MNIKTVIFDLDGTIADTLPLCISAFRKSIEPLLKKELSDDEIIATFGPSEEGTINQLIPDFKDEGLKAYLLHYEELHETCPVPFPGIKEVLELLRSKNIRLAMVTGKGPESTEISLRKFGLDDFFPVRETGSPDGPNKIAGIRNVLDRLHTSPEESIYVGDAPTDIKYCKEVGIPIAAAAWATTTQAPLLEALNPDWLFHSVEEFKDWITENI